MKRRWDCGVLLLPSNIHTRFGSNSMACPMPITTPVRRTQETSNASARLIIGHHSGLALRTNPVSCDRR